MITITSNVGYYFTLHFDKADITAVRKLADAYVIPSDAMIIACINKGIEVIGKQVQKADEHKNHEDGYNGSD